MSSDGIKSLSVVSAFTTIPSTAAVKVMAHDGSQKYVFQLPDGPCAEAAFFKIAGRARPNIACLSTLLGCAVGCIFCATATGPFHRDLTAEEICRQVDTIVDDRNPREILDEGFEISFMGMGYGNCFSGALIRASVRRLHSRDSPPEEL